MLHRLLILQLNHQIRKPPIRPHQTSRRTHKPIRQFPHASKEPILKDPISLIHEISQLDGKSIHARLVPRNGRDLRHDNGLAVFIVHTLEVLNAGIAVGAVIVESKIIRWIGRNETHEFLQPFLSILVVRRGRTDEFLPLLLPQRHHLIVPRLRRPLRTDAVLIWLIEEMYNMFLGVEDILPVLARELCFEVDHGAKRSAAVNFGWDPGVPVGDGRKGSVEVALVHGPRDAGVAGAGAIGPVPEEGALLDYHVDSK